LIRTFQTEGNNIYCHGGGGIVIDSDPEQEIQESLFKVEALMRTLEGI
jgi:para-aminobenzoate synthetase component 1